MKKISLLFTMSVAVVFMSYSQGYEISIKFNVFKDTVMLGHHRATQLIPNDTVVTDKSGKAVFKGKNKLPGGMYFMYFSNGRYYDFLIDKDQTFSIQGDTSDFSSIKYKGCEQNEIFSSYQKNMNEFNIKLRDLYELRKEAEDKTAIDKKIKNERDKLENLFNMTVSENKDMFFIDFLKATRDVIVPDSIKERDAQYYYFRNHFFDNFDYGDARLLRTPIYESKIDVYLDKVVPQMPDTLIKEVDLMIEAARDDEEHFKYMLIHLFNKYVSSKLMTHENVYIHIAEKYYIPEAEWSSPEFISDLKERVAKKKKHNTHGICSRNI